MEFRNQLQLIGRWIEIHRKGKSQKEIAAMSGVTQQQISNIEAGKNATAKTLIQILKAMDLQITIPFCEKEVQELEKKRVEYDKENGGIFHVSKN